MGIDLFIEIGVVNTHKLPNGGARKMHSGSLTINRIQVGMPPPLRDLLVYESKMTGLTVPAVIRDVMLEWAKRHPKYRPQDRLL